MDKARRERTEAEFATALREITTPLLRSIRPTPTEEQHASFIKALAHALYLNQNPPSPSVLPAPTRVRRDQLTKLYNSCCRLMQNLADLDLELYMEVVAAYAFQEDDRRYDFDTRLTRLGRAIEEVEGKIKGTRQNRWKWEEAIVFIVFLAYKEHLGRPTIEGPFRELAEWAVWETTGNELGERVFKRTLKTLRDLFLKKSTSVQEQD